MGLTVRTEIASLELDGADGALLRGDERAHVLLGPGERSLRRLAQEGLVPVVGSRLIFVQGVYGRDAGQRDEREEEACRRPTGAHGSMRTRRHRFGRMRMRWPRARSVVALGHPLQIIYCLRRTENQPGHRVICHRRPGASAQESRAPGLYAPRDERDEWPGSIRTGRGIRTGRHQASGGRRVAARGAGGGRRGALAHPDSPRRRPGGP